MNQPGTLHARSTAGSVEAPPEAGRVVRFGRGGAGPDARVDLVVGADDLGVSRRHGELAYRQGYWWLRNTGQRLLRLAGHRQLHNAEEPVALAVGYTQVVVPGSANLEHMVELYVFGEIPPTAPPADARTVAPKRWKLVDDERLVLVVMGQRYLGDDPDPRPLTYREIAVELEAMQPERIWGADWAQKRRELARDQFLARLDRKAEGTLEKVRNRLEKDGFPYDLRQAERAAPSDDRLKRNLIRGLLESTTLGPGDLDLLDYE